MNIGNMARSIIGVTVVMIVIITVAIPIIGQFTEEGEGTSGTNPYYTPLGTADESPSMYYYLIDNANTLEWDTSSGFTLNDEPLGSATQWYVYIFNLSEQTQYVIRSLPGEDKVFLFENGSGSSTAMIEHMRVENGLLYTDDSDYLQVNAGTVLFGWVGPIDALDSQQSYIQILGADASGTKTLDESLYVNDGDVLFALFGIFANIGLADEPRVELGDIGNVGSRWNDVTLNLAATDNDSFKIDSVSYSKYYLDSTDKLMLVFPPTYYTELKSDAPVSGATGDIIAIIPLIMVVGVLIGAVGLFVLNRRS